MRALSAAPGTVILSSAFAAACALGCVLWITRPRPGEFEMPDRALTITPERAAEGFITAYRAQAFERAASFATGSLARAVRARAQNPHTQNPPAAPSDDRQFVLQESHVLRAQRLRLVGVLIHPNQDESEGQAVSLVVMKDKGRYWVEDLEWPSAPAEAL
jgi:hypothetical protein